MELLFLDRPLLYVAAASTQRPVYRCLHAEYKDRQQQAFAAFDQEFFRYKREIEEAIAKQQPKSGADVAKELERIVRLHYATMCGLVQLESGEYDLTLTIKYEKIGILVWKRHRSTSSYGYFTVDDTGLNAYKDRLLNVLYLRADNILKGKNDTIQYPVYKPKHFIEAKEQRR